QRDQVDEAYLLEQCPKLDSLVSETLRLTVTNSLGRVIMEPTVVGGKVLEPGNKIMVRLPVVAPLYCLSDIRQLPIHELHYDTEIWGAEPGSLDPNRFVENPKLSKSQSYRPWGGGHTLCPGRFLAKRSANAFVAILVTKYNVTVQSDTFPKSDGARPSPGVVTIGRGEDLKLRLRPRV
ncbi:cytochrome P450, partial [Lophiostoma macrostomum CBS 122681]